MYSYDMTGLCYVLGEWINSYQHEHWWWKICHVVLYAIVNTHTCTMLLKRPLILCIVCFWKSPWFCRSHAMPLEAAFYQTWPYQTLQALQYMKPPWQSMAVSGSSNVEWHACARGPCGRLDCCGAKGPCDPVLHEGSPFTRMRTGSLLCVCCATITYM